MKTKIVIEIDTELNPIFPLDDDGEMDMDNPVTKEVEDEIHKMIDQDIRDYIEERLEEEIMDNISEIDYSVEGYDSFTDYGKFKFTITTEAHE